MSEVWFGTKDHMQWIPAPAVNVSAGKQGHQSQVVFTNGGAFVRRSKTSHKRYNFAWNMKNFEEIQPVLDYADGVYGNGYIYYSNPFNIGRNALPAYWASPFMNYYDGPVIVDSVRPTLVSSGSVNGYPVESAQYSLTSSSRVPSIFIPIPPNHTAYVGAHGQLASGSATVRVIPEISATGSDTPVDLTLLTTATSDRTNATFSGNSYIGITLTMRSASTGSLILSGLMVQVLPDGAVIESGGFISGQGQSGLAFASQPVVSEYSAALDRVGVSAEMVETEAWSWR
jgi:hypothetical protein